MLKNGCISRQPVPDIRYIPPQNHTYGAELDPAGSSSAPYVYAVVDLASRFVQGLIALHALLLFTPPLLVFLLIILTAVLTYCVVKQLAWHLPMLRDAGVLETDVFRFNLLTFIAQKPRCIFH